jgi:multidrug efflux system membrane fusion protein
MKRIITIVVLLAIAAGFYFYAYPRLAGVPTANAQQTAAAGSSQRGGKGGGGFATAVVTAIAQQQSVPITKSAVAYIEPANTVVVRSRADGMVVAAPLTEGQTVKTGDVLFKLDDSAIQATLAKDSAQIAKDQANADAAQAALEREQELVKKAVDPQSSLDAAVAAAKSAQATVTVDQAQLRADQVQLSYMTIKAPIDGRIGTVNTSVGNVVHAADTSADGLVTITQMSPLRVSFSIAEGDLGSFRAALAKTPKGLSVKIAAPGDKTARATGNLNFIDSSVDTSSGTIVLKADVDNSSGALWPGQYVTATTQLGAYDNATTIPLEAVQQGSDGSYVYAVGAGSKVKKQPVSVIATVGDEAVVGKEVKPGDHVVIEGQLRLADGSPVKETVQKGTEVADRAGTGGNNGAPSGGGSNPAATGSASTGNS